ncbi:NAD(P)H-quinone oxidoreductase subunit M protein [Thalictrum thalictroides]|uniref:NAD(P)H-quinone oxidoreductase subunit M, chloroplastic n=1 Tax=Thalictrum thalictroides TaxID=46969 RepID=A0A7J6XEB5_THATH|nr:NAD(P)H-quinone oxidoreductase subunit M protein [Thalictrum thalictroides]
MASTSFSIMGWVGGKRGLGGRKINSIRAQETEIQPSQINLQPEQEEKQTKVKSKPPPVTQPPQLNAKSKNMGVEYGGQWLSSVTRHVRIYAAYIDPVTNAFDQTQMDKLTLILDPTNEFVWTSETCNMVYAYFQELVDHYEGAPLTEYTLRLIGSDIEHYIRKLLYDGEIKYNMNARVLNFSMGKPRVKFNNNKEVQDLQ